MAAGGPEAGLVGPARRVRERQVTLKLPFIRVLCGSQT
jgi:hypothetical protein